MSSPDIELPGKHQKPLTGSRTYDTPTSRHETNDADSDNPPRLVHWQPHAVDGPRLVADQEYDGPGHLERRDGRDGFRGPGLEGVDGSVQALSKAIW